jgi:hypothetical protein
MEKMSFGEQNAQNATHGKSTKEVTPTFLHVAYVDASLTNPNRLGWFDVLLGGTPHGAVSCSNASQIRMDEESNVETKGGHPLLNREFKNIKQGEEKSHQMKGVISYESMMCPIGFSSKRCVRTRSSSTDTELLGIRSGIRESEFIHNILIELGLITLDTIFLLCDSANVVCSSNGVKYPTSKNLRLDYHTIKEDTTSGRCRILKIPGWLNQSDHLTKAWEECYRDMIHEYMHSGRCVDISLILKEEMLSGS